MKKQKLFSIVTLAAASVLLLAACGGNKASNGGKEQVNTSKFPVETTNKDAAVKDGQLDIAVVNDAPFQGLFNMALCQDNNDQLYMGPTGSGTIFFDDEHGKFKDGGPATFKLDKDAKKATVTFRKDLKWNDGKPVTADDYIFTYKFIADKDYTGVRYGNITSVVGVEEYHDGKATDISGLKKVDDYTVEITYKEVSPSITIDGDGGQLGYLIAKHQWENVPVKNAESNDAIRKHPLSFGPYYISKVVAGESVEYSPNPYYYGAKPKLSKIVATNVSSTSILQALQAKKYDVVYQMPTDNYDKYKDTKGYTMLGDWDFAYSYIGFNLGTYDAKKAVNVYNPNSKMANKSLRQAMGYALDMDAVGKKFYAGLRTRANTLISPIFGDLSASVKDVPGYALDLEKAKKLLDDAGYKDVNKDGLREDPNGKELKINLAFMSGGETSEPISKYFLQQWKSIGLDVQLTGGKLLDFQTFYQKVQANDASIDVYQAAWATDWNPSPTSLYGPQAAFNMTRFVSDENTKLCKEIDSSKSFDEAYYKEKLIEWQKYASEEAYVIPTQFRYHIVPVSERVANYDIKAVTPANTLWENVAVTKASR